mmetsp:Transcript_27587/g.49726  ORF Transcript_27587/g.49726 Transcript_27587/m.49726 type:complete len:87 (+) Transcript_27587:819-1079(+)
MSGYDSVTPEQGLLSNDNSRPLLDTSDRNLPAEDMLNCGAPSTPTNSELDASDCVHKATTAPRTKSDAGHKRYKAISGRPGSPNQV